MTEPTAYERLQQAAATANRGARLLALQTLRNVHRECSALETDWADRQDPGADEVLAVLARIRAQLAPAVGAPAPAESLEGQAARLVRHLFGGQPTEPEHCVHSRAMHDQHHQQPVDECPWCSGGTTHLDPGDLL
ncbi:hypothetical protein ACWCYZ_16790 [Streptomyces virginiae]